MDDRQGGWGVSELFEPLLETDRDSISLLQTRFFQVKRIMQIAYSHVSYAHTSPPARGERPLPKMLRQQINRHCHRAALAHENAIREKMLSDAARMLKDGLIIDDVLAALGIVQ